MHDSDDEQPFEDWMDPFPGVTDAASARKFVADAIDEATDEEYDSLAKAYLGDQYDEWKRLKAAGAMDARDRARARTATGPANVTGGQPKPEAPASAAAAAAAARFQQQKS